jgi:hypothetical protein
MKRLLKGLFGLLLVFALLGAVPMVYAEGGEQPAAVYVDGKLQIFSDAQPIIVDGRTLVPIRSVAEVLGAQVNWEDSTQTVLINKDDKHIELTIGSKSPTVNGSPVNLDAPAVIINGRTMVPLRFVSEALGAKVVWDGTVKIYSDPSKAPAEQPKTDNMVNNPDVCKEFRWILTNVPYTEVKLFKTTSTLNYWGGEEKKVGKEKFHITYNHVTYNNEFFLIVQHSFDDSDYAALAKALEVFANPEVAQRIIQTIKTMPQYSKKNIKAGKKNILVEEFAFYVAITIPD